MGQNERERDVYLDQDKENIENTIANPRYSYVRSSDLKYAHGDLEMATDRIKQELLDARYISTKGQMDPRKLQKSVCKDLAGRTRGAEDCQSGN